MKNQITKLIYRAKKQVDGDNSGEYILPMEVIQILEDIINERKFVVRSITFLKILE